MKKLIIILFMLNFWALSPQTVNSLSNKRILAEVVVNGVNGNALIDTGSTVSIIDIDKTKKFGFVIGGKYAFDLTTIKGDDINIYYPLMLDARLFGKMIYPILATDIDNVRRSIKKDTGIEIDMIIGMKSMKQIGVTISMSDSTIILSNNAISNN